MHDPILKLISNLELDNLVFDDDNFITGNTGVVVTCSTYPRVEIKTHKHQKCQGIISGYCLHVDHLSGINYKLLQSKLLYHMHTQHTHTTATTYV